MASESHLPHPHPTSSSFPWASLFHYFPRAKMSRNGRLELKLNLSPPLQGNNSRRTDDDDNDNDVSPNFSSSPSSCVSSEAANSPEATSMVLAGCPRCLMYVMLAEDDPRCPRCKSTVLLDFLNNNNTTTKNKNKRS